MTFRCDHPVAFRAEDGFGRVRCVGCWTWLDGRVSLFKRLLRKVRGGAA